MRNASLGLLACAAAVLALLGWRGQQALEAERAQRASLEDALAEARERVGALERSLAGRAGESEVYRALLAEIGSQARRPGAPAHTAMPRRAPRERSAFDDLPEDERERRLAFAELAAPLYVEQRFQALAALAEDEILRDPDWLVAYAHAGVAYARLGDYERARERLAVVRERGDPRDPGLQTALVVLRMVEVDARTASLD